MRRKDRAVTEIQEIIEIIERCKVCRVAMVDQGKPYIVPLNFGYHYKNNVFEFYFHSALKGRKLELLKENPQVCIEMDGEHQLVEAEKACENGYLYESIIGEGKVSFIEKLEEKKEALNELMKHLTHKSFNFNDQDVQKVAVFKVTLDHISAKARRI